MVVLGTGISARYILKEPAAASFTGLVDLAAASFGGKALGASDDFFAGVENLIQPGRGVFVPDRFTEHGKWMDGWESRRKRSAGYDFCILELGALGQVLAFDIDTHHFIGNHPSFASVDGVVAEKETPFAELARGTWRELLRQTPLLPDAQNLFAAEPTGPVTHLRLNIFPDGGVARFRAFGRVHPTWQPADLDGETRRHVAPNAIDLAALTNGAFALACSDAHFGPMNNLLLPGRAENMGGGWETRRKRAPGHDWILIKLGTRGTAQVIEIDTQHFKGNYPDRCSVEVIDAPSARITDLVQSAAWSPLLPKVKLHADTRHFFRSELVEPAVASHLRLNIYPDGGVSRLRVWGSADG
jgi:allantoicase